MACIRGLLHYKFVLSHPIIFLLDDFGYRLVLYPHRGTVRVIFGTQSTFPGRNVKFH